MPDIDERKFYNSIIVNKEYEDLFEYWGSYNDKMLAYSINNIYENIEVGYNAIKIDPEYVKKYPAYALIYNMNKYYLKDKKFKYVNCGFISLSHYTNIQKFLISKFNSNYYISI